MDLVYAFLLVILMGMAYNIRRDIGLNQQSLDRITASAERIAQIAQDVSDKTDAILGRLP